MYFDHISSTLPMVHRKSLPWKHSVSLSFQSIEVIYGWWFIWMIYMDDLYCFMISMHLYFMPFHAPKKFGSSEAQLSGHKAASLCMESLNLPFDSIQICPSRTLQSKDGNHLVAVASGSYRIIQNPIRNHPDHTLTYLDLIWFDIFWW
jgi:hypothetical protein